MNPGKQHLLTLLFALFTLAVWAQPAAEHLKRGIAKHEQKDYLGAIVDYEKALKADPLNKDAYFNRGTCKLLLRDYQAAITDFDKAIILDSGFAKAYYNRASSNISLKKYAAALPDLDKTMALDPTMPNALITRGQVRAQTGDKKGACEDFIRAKSNKDKQADKLLAEYCGNEQQQGESLLLNWPEEENWKVGNSQEDERMAMIELIHSDETLENWTEFGYMSSIKGATNVAMDRAMNLMFEQAKQNAPGATLTFIEKDETTTYPWIIFIIEAPGFKNDKRPESQLWYIVQGKTSLYTNFRALKKAAIPATVKEKWIRFFKTAKVVDQ